MLPVVKCQFREGITDDFVVVGLPPRAVLVALPPLAFANSNPCPGIESNSRTTLSHRIIRRGRPLGPPSPASEPPTKLLVADNEIIDHDRPLMRRSDFESIDW